MEARVITRIEPTRRTHGLTPIRIPELRKVAGYARVSTESEEQENSYEAQVRYFTNFIQNHEGWTFAGMYTDAGISGTGTAHRSGFTQMVQDALAGKFSLIVTKSISRWARNTVDSLTTIRKLKEHGCEVFFEKENIWTMDSKGELLITIMSSLAQEESRSISENTTWGIRQSFSEGKFSLPYGNFLGYCKGPNGTPEIVPEEAEIVRGIYKSFLDGETPGSIARLLTARGVSSPGGKGKWHQTTVRSILQNEKYYGSALLQKTFTTDFLTHRKKKNDGELPQYHIENSHPAIVTKEQWDLVQVELERRSRMPGRFSPKGPLGSRLVCADCGGFFGAKTWHSSDPYKTVIWRCNDKYRPGIERKSGGEKCCTGHVTEEKVMAAFSNIVDDLIARKPQVVEACEAVLHELLDSSATDEKRKRLEQEGDAIAKEIEALVERQARQTVEGFADKYQELEKRYRRIEEKLKAVATDRQDRAYRAKQAELFLETLKRLPKQAKLESTELFMSLVDKVIVGDGLTFIVRDGTEKNVNGVR